MKKNKHSLPNYPKHILQLGILGILVYFVVRTIYDPSYFVDFEGVCPLGGIQAGVSFLTRGSLACSMTSAQIFVGFLLVVAIVFFSKLFCAFVCPIGTISEWLGKLGDKYKIRYTIHGIPDILLRSLKYLLLFTTFYYTLESSELFCKKFDPYYAVTNGFGYDVNTTWAIASIVVVILGSVFFRLFWCRYLCPLGALSNIFKYFLVTALVLLIHYVLVSLGVKISFIGPLAVICIVSYLIEAFEKKSIMTPVFRVTRNSKSCINCGVCTNDCPQGIRVDEHRVVDHIDCNMCGDCLMSCPVGDTLKVNKKNWLKWAPGIVTVLLIAFSFAFGDRFEVPTIEERWGTEEQIKNSSVLTHAGLKNIKCYGSSMAFANQMRKINGVYGVTAYVKTKTVKIYYDPLKLDEQKIMKTIFTPEKKLIHRPGQEVGRVVQVDMMLENFFDVYDTRDLERLLSSRSDVLGFSSEYSCPVKVSVFLCGDHDRVVDVKRLKKLVETHELHYNSGGMVSKRELNFNVVKIGFQEETLSRDEFLGMMFKEYRNLFQSYYRTGRNQICLMEFPFSDVEEPEKSKWLPYLSSHLSFNSGILGFETVFKDGQGWGVVHYAQDVISEKEIMMLLKQDTLRVRYSSGDDRKYANPFVIDSPDEVILRLNVND